MRLRGVVMSAFVLGASGCRDCRHAPTDAGKWPALPADDGAARRVIEQARLRASPAEDAALAGEASVAFVRAGLTARGTVAGFDAIDEAIATRVGAEGVKNVVVLFGSAHDSAAPIDAFRRLVGPRARVPWTRITIEQLHADGRWANVDANAQQGDDAALDRYAKSGSRDDLAAVLAVVQRDTYTAWKYGAVDVIGDLLGEARAANRPVSGCDMPPALRARVASLGESSVHALREAHCAMALRDAAKDDRGPHRIAALWGRTHVTADRFPRFIPPDWSVQVVSVLDAPGGGDVVLVDPILAGHALVLPSPDGAKRFERKRTKADRPAPKSAFASTTKKSVRAPVAFIDGERFDGEPTKVASGRHVLVVDKSGTMIAAAIEVPANGAVEVTVADDAPEITATIVEPP